MARRKEVHRQLVERQAARPRSLSQLARRSQIGNVGRRKKAQLGKLSSFIVVVVVVVVSSFIIVVAVAVKSMIFMIISYYSYTYTIPKLISANHHPLNHYLITYNTHL